MFTLDPAAAALNGGVGRELDRGAPARVMGEEMAADHLHVFRVQVDSDRRRCVNMLERLPDKDEHSLRLEAELFIEELLGGLRGQRGQLRRLIETEAAVRLTGAAQQVAEALPFLGPFVHGLRLPIGKPRLNRGGAELMGLLLRLPEELFCLLPGALEDLAGVSRGGVRRSRRFRISDDVAENSGMTLRDGRSKRRSLPGSHGVPGSRQATDDRRQGDEVKGGPGL
jgi:hypothetical protein